MAPEPPEPSPVPRTVPRTKDSGLIGAFAEVGCDCLPHRREEGLQQKLGLDALENSVDRHYYAAGCFVEQSLFIAVFVFDATPVEAEFTLQKLAKQTAQAIGDVVGAEHFFVGWMCGPERKDAIKLTGIEGLFQPIMLTNLIAPAQGFGQPLSVCIVELMNLWLHRFYFLFTYRFSMVNMITDNHIQGHLYNAGAAK